MGQIVATGECHGELLGCQAKNQIPVEEEPYYVAEGGRRLFEVDGVPFGITICHEGWRYPEAVRWAAVRGARLVFHPQLTGSDRAGVTIQRWGDPSSPYYEKAMIARSVENTAPRPRNTSAGVHGASLCSEGARS